MLWKGQCRFSFCLLNHAYKSSSAPSSANPAFPEAFPVGAGAAEPPSPPSGNLKLFPKPRDCCRFCENISYRRMSWSVTDRLAYCMASSKCSLKTSNHMRKIEKIKSKWSYLVMTGTGSSSSSSSSILASSPAASSFSFFSRMRLISPSIDSRMANLAAR